MTNVKSRLDDIISLDELSSFPRGMEDDLFFEEIIKNNITSVLRLQLGSSVPAIMIGVKLKYLALN